MREAKLYCKAKSCQIHETEAQFYAICSMCPSLVVKFEEVDGDDSQEEEEKEED